MRERTVLFLLLGACNDAIDWLADHAHLSDREVWEACEVPEWLRFVAERGDCYSRATLHSAISPIIRTMRRAIDAAVNAYPCSEAELPFMTDLDWSEASRRCDEACRRAALNACSMIRHTVAMPRRDQLEAATVEDAGQWHDFPF